MPKFTIATDAGHGPEAPGETIEFPDTKAATDDALIALAEMARETLPNGKTANFAVTVANEAGEEIYAAEMRFKAHTSDDLEHSADTPDIAGDLPVGPRD